MFGQAIQAIDLSFCHAYEFIEVIASAAFPVINYASR
jgi:hypothetical protein